MSFKEQTNYKFPADGILVDVVRQQRLATFLWDGANVPEAQFEILDFRFERGGTEIPAKDCERRFRAQLSET